MWLLDLELDADDTLVIADYEAAVDLKVGTVLEGVPVLDASFSPDGTKIVFLADDPADSDGYSDVWVPVTPSTLRPAPGERDDGGDHRGSGSTARRDARGRHRAPSPR